MFNVDMKSISNTMGLLVDKQKTLASFGIEMRTQGDKILNALVTAPKQWGMALHAFAGMQMYGKDYLRDTGQQMGAGFAYMASRFGYKAATGAKFTETGALTMGKAGVTEADLMANRLDTMLKLTREQTATIQDPGERFMAQTKILQDVWGIQDENARIAMLTLEKGGKSALANDAIRLSLLSERQISEKMLSAQEKTEQYQRIIAAMLPMGVGLLRLLPDKLANLMGLGGAEAKRGAKAFDKYLEASTDALAKLAGPAKGLLAPFMKEWERSGIAKTKEKFGTEEKMLSYLKDLGDEIKDGPGWLRRGVEAVGGPRLATAWKKTKAEQVKEAEEAMSKYYPGTKEGEARRRALERTTPGAREGRTIHVGTPKMQGGGLASAGSPYIIHPGMESINLSGSEALFIPGSDMNLVPHGSKTAGGGKMSQINITLYGYNSPSDIVNAVQEGLANMA